MCVWQASVHARLCAQVDADSFTPVAPTPFPAQRPTHRPAPPPRPPATLMRALVALLEHPQLVRSLLVVSKVSLTPLYCSRGWPACAAAWFKCVAPAPPLCGTPTPPHPPNRQVVHLLLIMLSPQMDVSRRADSSGGAFTSSYMRPGAGQWGGLPAGEAGARGRLCLQVARQRAPAAPQARPRRWPPRSAPLPFPPARRGQGRAECR